MEQFVVISFGSNKGDWKVIFQSAESSIQNFAKKDKESSVFKTEPWGETDQPWFKNKVVGYHTLLSAKDFFAELMTIESEQGRNRMEEKRWGERTLDLDILFYGQNIIETPILTIPHERINQRRFVLEPLNEIYSDFVHPGNLKSINELLRECRDKSQVEKIVDVI